MKIINLFGTVGSGKSTTASYIFSRFKNLGMNVELSFEYAKEMIYSKRQHEMSNQIYLLAKQYKKLKDIQVYGGVTLVITDSPLLQNLIYSSLPSHTKELDKLTKALANEFENINVLIKRVNEYKAYGRNQTEKESDLMAKVIKELNVKWDYKANGDEAGQQKLFNELMVDFGEKCV